MYSRYWECSDYVFYLCIGGVVTMYSSCVLGVQCICIITIFWGYNDYVF